MKNLLILISLLFAFNSFAQPTGPFARQSFNYDLSGGDKIFTTGRFLGFSRLSFQLETTDLDSATATIQIQKSNNGVKYLDIVGATLTFNDTTQTNYIEIENAKNDRYKIVLIVNTVTEGLIDIHMTAIR